MNRVSKRLFPVLSLCLLALSTQAATGAGPYCATPAWDQTLPAETRFLVLTNMNGEAVLDRETGLVWERSLFGNRADYAFSISECRNRTWGKRLGWRLPNVEELATLVDYTVGAPGPLLPPGHPFNLVGTIYRYWTATAAVDDATVGYVVDFTGAGRILAPTFKSSEVAYQWCVRGSGSTS